MGEVVLIILLSALTLTGSVAFTQHSGTVDDDLLCAWCDAKPQGYHSEWAMRRKILTLVTFIVLQQGRLIGIRQQINNVQ